MKPLPRRMDRSTLPNINRRSEFIGVSWHSRHKKWQANITISYITKNLGLYLDEEEAARMYDEQAILLGRSVNFPLHEGMEQAVKPAPKKCGKRYLKMLGNDEPEEGGDNDDEGLCGLCCLYCHFTGKAPCGT